MSHHMSRVMCDCSGCVFNSRKDGGCMRYFVRLKDGCCIFYRDWRWSGDK